MKLNTWTIYDWFERHNYHPVITSSDQGEWFDSFYLAPTEVTSGSTALLKESADGCIICGQSSSIFLPGCSVAAAVQEFTNMQRFFNEWERNSFLSLIDVRNPQSLVDLASDVFDRPICFKNNEEFIFSQTDNFESAVKALSVSDSAPSAVLSPSYQNIKTARQPIIYYSHFYHCIVAQANLWKKQENVASIIILENGRPFTTGDIFLIEQFTTFMQSFLDHDRSDLFSGGGIASLLVDLVRGKDISLENLQLIYSVKRWTVNDMYIILCFQDIFDGETPLKRSLRGTLSFEFPTCQLMFYEDVIGIINVTRTGSYESVIETLKSILPANSPPLAASHPFKGLERLNIYYRQAQLAIRYAQQNGLPFAHTYDIALTHMTDMIYNDQTCNHMLHPDVLHLLSIDHNEGSSYSSTLLAFLLSGGNYTDTAQKLKLHRNTVIYRINQILELISTDLRDPENQKLMLFSALVLEPHFPQKRASAAVIHKKDHAE